MFGSLCILMGIFTWFFVPETKGLSLEKMDELFGVTENSAKEIDAESPSTRPRSVCEVTSEKA